MQRSIAAFFYKETVSKIVIAFNWFIFIIILDIVIDVLGKGETKKRKLKNLCKTRWIERHSTCETIYDLYEYVVTTPDEICVPSEDERL